MAETKDELPVLPRPAVPNTHLPLPDAFSKGSFTADQMHAFRQEGVAAAQSRINALLEEVEGLRKDAERYRWLRAANRVRHDVELEGGSRVIDKSKLYALMVFHFWCKREDLDAAIDKEVASLSAGRSGSGEAT